LLAAGDRVMIPEIVDYEIRRELLRAGKTKGVAKLDALGRQLGLLPCSGPVLVEAAVLWAKARQEGLPTADDKAIDADVILAATAILASRQGYEVIIATSNVGHLGRFVDARLWEMIVP
jgi:predicted nucleic acid-binding protein